MPVVRGDPSAVRLELRGDDDHGGLGETFDEDGVVDTPRRARASVAETDDAAVDQARPLVEVSPRPLGAGAGALSGNEGHDVSTVTDQLPLPFVYHDLVRPPGAIEAQADLRTADATAEGVGDGCGLRLGRWGRNKDPDVAHRHTVGRGWTRAQWMARHAAIFAGSPP